MPQTGWVKPKVVLLGVRPLLESYNPSQSAFVRRLYELTPNLRAFMESFTFHRLLESLFVRNYDLPEADYFVWEFIDSLYPSGTGQFGDDVEAMENFGVLKDTFAYDLDILVRRRMIHHGLDDHLTEYYFHTWADPYTMLLTHIDCDASELGDL